MGAVIGGRSTYEAAEHWGEENPFGVPFFIVTIAIGLRVVGKSMGSALIAGSPKANRKTDSGTMVRNRPFATRAMRAPACASATAIAFPKPRLAPVISAAFSFNLSELIGHRYSIQPLISIKPA